MPPPKIRKRPSKENMMKKIKDKKGFAKSCLRGLLSHGGLLLIVVLYAILGAYMLIYIEKEQEEERFAAKKQAGVDLEGTRKYLADYAWYHSFPAQDEMEFKHKITLNLDLYHKQIVYNAQNNNYDGNPNTWNYDWGFSKALLFTVTTMGAIGYGHIVPKTITGQYFTIYYGMIGIPLLLLFLANIGDFLANSFKYIYSRLCCRWCRIRRVVSGLKSKSKLKKKVLWKEEIGTESYMPSSQIDVPIVVNLLVIYVYLLMGGALFAYWEGWEIHQAVYFTFVTLTTIGFGDFVPGNSFSTNSDQVLIASLKMLVTICFCMFGMALLSMAINLMQEQLVLKAKWMAKEMGIAKSEVDDSWKYKNIKRHEPGTVVETPPDRDGNQAKLINIDDPETDNKKKKGNNMV